MTELELRAEGAWAAVCTFCGYKVTDEHSSFIEGYVHAAEQLLKIK